MRKIKCEFCGKELDEKSAFCTGCGAKVNKTDDVEKKDNEEKIDDLLQKSVEKPESKFGTFISIVAIILVALILFLVWFFVIRGDGKSKEQKTKNNESNNIETKFNGYLYLLNDGYGWAKDNKYYYLIDTDGNIITKVDYVYYNEDPIFHDGYSQLLNTIYNTKGEKVLSLENEYQYIKYVEKGYVIVEVKEENYKGTSVKKGVYDLNTKSYVYNLDDNVNKIEYLGEGMFLIQPKVSFSSQVKVYNTETKKSFNIGTNIDSLFGTYKDGYIVYRDSNSSSVYLLDKNGTKKLVYSGEKNVSLGQFSDGLVYIKDAFYDVNGNKVIDLKDEGVKGAPQFVNGYALIYFKTGYYTTLSKETKKYVFTPKKYTELTRYYSGDYEFGILENQDKLSDSGYIIVKINEDDKVWAIMNYDGEVILKIPVGFYVFGKVSKDGYVSIDGPAEDYYLNVDGKKVELNM